MAKDTYIVKLYKEDEKGFYQTCTEKDENSCFNILAYDPDEQQAFRAEITQEDLMKMKSTSTCENFDKSANDAFSTSDKGSVFALDSETKELLWKKVGDSNIRIRIGRIPITEIDPVAAQKRIFERQIEQDELIKQFKEEKSRLGFMLRDAQKQSQMFREDKEALEKELIGKFLEILRTKQDKISELQEELNTKIEGPASLKNNIKFMEISSSSDEESNNPESSIDSQNFLSLS